MAQQPGIGNQLEAQPKDALDTLLTGIGVARSLVCGTLELGIAKAAIATLGQKVALPDFGKVSDQGFVVFLINLGALGNLQYDICTLGAVAVAPHAVNAGLGLEMLLVAVVDQRIESADYLDPDVAALAAIAAIGAAKLDELLAAKGYRSRATVTGADMHLCLVQKFHRILPFSLGK